MDPCREEQRQIKEGSLPRSNRTNVSLLSPSSALYCSRAENQAQVLHVSEWCKQSPNTDETILESAAYVCISNSCIFPQNWKKSRTAKSIFFLPLLRGRRRATGGPWTKHRYLSSPMLWGQCP